MEHLTLERLACLVDESAEEAEKEHLARCTHCRSEFGALVQQTQEFAQLPLGPLGSSDLRWNELEVVLKQERLLRMEPSFPTSSWIRAAASLLLFIFGGAVGWGARGMGSDTGGAAAGPSLSVALESGTSGGEHSEPSQVTIERQGVVVGMGEAAEEPISGSAVSNPAESPPAASAQVLGDAESSPAASSRALGDPGFDLPRLIASDDSGEPVTDTGGTADLFLALGSGTPYAVGSLEEAESVVRVAEAFYIDALVVYRELLEQSGFTVNDDPVGRFVALGNVIAITEEAVSLAPTDPFLNALLLTTLVERDAVQQGMMTFAAGR